MNIVEKVIEKAGGQTELADKLTAITRHLYQQGHVSYWKKKGYFPPDLAGVIADTVMEGRISEREACPKIKRARAA